MATTFANLKSYVTHYLASSPTSIVTDVATTAGRIVNEAGRYLFDMHQWSWRNRASATIGYTQDQNYADLPSDFGELAAGGLVENGSVYGRTISVGLSTIRRLRESDSNTGNTGNRYYALEYPTQTAVTNAAPNARLALYPTPASTDASAAQLTYRAKWIELSSDTDVPNIQLRYESLLFRLVEAFALEQEQEGRGAIDAVHNSMIFRSLADADGSAQPILGPVVGGQLTSLPTSDIFWTVTQPS